MNACSNCGSTHLTWDYSTKNLSGVVDGRLRANEVTVVFFLGCDSCSETLNVLSPDEFLAHVNRLHNKEQS